VIAIAGMTVAMIRKAHTRLMIASEFAGEISDRSTTSSVASYMFTIRWRRRRARTASTTCAIASVTRSGSSM